MEVAMKRLDSLMVWVATVIVTVGLWQHSWQAIVVPVVTVFAVGLLRSSGKERDGERS
jgi:hypothetical protein